MAETPPNRSFLTEVYQRRYQQKHSRNRLRAPGFRTIFEQLEAMDKPEHEFTIVETGTTRKPTGFSSQGCATLVFDAFINFYSGRVHSVDLDGEAVARCQKLVSERTKVTCADSLQFLRDGDFNPIDLLYLDSMDVNPGNPKPSSEHHLLELLIAQPHLRNGTIIAVDDCKPPNMVGGKGGRVREHLLRTQAAELLHDGYIEVWRLLEADKVAARNGDS